MRGFFVLILVAALGSVLSLVLTPMLMRWANVL
jgi:hypothetical protein